MNVMLLAAGFGTRLRPYTDKTPKPVIPFLTVPLACYSLALLENFKIENLVVNTHYLPKQVKTLFQQIKWPAKKLIFSDEQKQILGSGGGVRHAISNLIGHDAFIVANADEVILPLDRNIMQKAVAFHKEHKGIATILTIPHAEVGKKFGGLWLKDSETTTKVSCFSKTSVVGHRGLHFVGIMILSDRIKDYFFSDDTQEENIFYETLTKAIKMGEDVHAFEIQAEWFETGNPADFILATKKCLEEIKKPQKSPWAQYLLQVLRKFSTGNVLIEKDYPLVEQEIAAVLNGTKEH